MRRSVGIETEQRHHVEAREVVERGQETVGADCDGRAVRGMLVIGKDEGGKDKGSVEERLLRMED